MAWPVYIEDDDSDGLYQARRNFRNGSVDHGGGSGALPQQHAAVGLNQEPFQQNIERQYPRIRNSRRFSYDDLYRSPHNSPFHTNTAQCSHANCAMRHSLRCRCNRRMSLQSLPINGHFPHCEFSGHIYRDSADTLNIDRLFSVYESANLNNERRLSIEQSLLFRSQHNTSQCNVKDCTYLIRPEYFMTFLAYQMEENGFHFPENLTKHVVPFDSLPVPLCFMIDTFSVSIEREMLQSQVLRISFPFDSCSFFTMLGAIKKGTISPEIIVTIFFFCSDLAIAALQENNGAMFSNIVSWTECYLRRLNASMSSKKQTYKIALTACVIGAMAIFVMLKHHRNP